VRRWNRAGDGNELLDTEVTMQPHDEVGFQLVDVEVGGREHPVGLHRGRADVVGCSGGRCRMGSASAANERGIVLANVCEREDK
jgi:hypothetical protein